VTEQANQVMARWSGGHNKYVLAGLAFMLMFLGVVVIPSFRTSEHPGPLVKSSGQPRQSHQVKGAALPKPVSAEGSNGPAPRRNVRTDVKNAREGGSDAVAKLRQLLAQFKRAFAKNNISVLQKIQARLVTMIKSDVGALKQIQTEYHRENDTTSKLIILSVITQAKHPLVFDLLYSEIGRAKAPVAIRREALIAMQGHLPRADSEHIEKQRIKTLLADTLRDAKESPELRRLALTVLAQASPTGEDRQLEDQVRTLLVKSDEIALLGSALAVAQRWRDDPEFIQMAKKYLESSRYSDHEEITEGAVGLLSYSKKGRAFLLQQLGTNNITKTRIKIIQELSVFLHEKAVREKLLRLMLNEQQDAIRTAVIQAVQRVEVPKREYLAALKVLIAKQEVSGAVRLSAAKAYIKCSVNTNKAREFLARVMRVESDQEVRKGISTLLKGQLDQSD